MNLQSINACAQVLLRRRGLDCNKYVHVVQFPHIPLSISEDTDTCNGKNEHNNTMFDAILSFVRTVAVWACTRL